MHFALYSTTTDTSNRSSNDTVIFMQSVFFITFELSWEAIRPTRFVMVTSNDLIGLTSCCLSPDGIASYQAVNQNEVNRCFQNIIL